MRAGQHLRGAVHQPVIQRQARRAKRPGFHGRCGIAAHHVPHPLQQHRRLEGGVAAHGKGADLIRFALADLEVDVDVLGIAFARSERHILDLEVQIPGVVILVAEPRLIQFEFAAVEQSVVQKIV